jgi:hypothetical protein
MAKLALVKALARLATRNTVKASLTGVHDCLGAAIMIERTVISLGTNYPIHNSVAYRMGLAMYLKYAGEPWVECD